MIIHHLNYNLVQCLKLTYLSFLKFLKPLKQRYFLIELYVSESRSSQNLNHFNRSDGRVVAYRASASGSVDLGSIPSRVKPMT